MAPLPTGYAYAGYPKATSLATNVLCMCRTTYLCEQVFAVMNIDKTKLRSTLKNDILNVASTQDLTTDIHTLVKAKKYQVSGAGLNR